MAADERSHIQQNIPIPSPDYSIRRMESFHAPRPPKHVKEPDVPNISSRIEMPAMWVRIMSKDDDVTSLKDNSLGFENPTYNLATPQYENTTWDSTTTPTYFRDYLRKPDTVPSKQ
ncbi:hypothetical protein ScPMuIL_005522 [Solemya velum]